MCLPGAGEVLMEHFLKMDFLLVDNWFAFSSPVYNEITIFQLVMCNAWKHHFKLQSFSMW